jgi:KUP system potassium uptake protein
MAALALGALGIVYGDIGTSPLYAFRETFHGHGHELQATEANVLGILSLIFWSLVAIISIKYLMFVMRADNEGEGGILALTSFLLPGENNSRRVLTRRTGVLVLLGLFGTSLLYGDGMITPAISVLAAVEGTKVAVPGIDRWIVPISVAILIGLFSIQSKGTARVGSVFGPIMLLWFGVLSALGLLHLVQEPSVLRAINPVYGIDYFLTNGFKGFLSLGAIFLVVTGGEALYADMGHFGRKPIMIGWFSLVFPALLLNYFGQGALLVGNPEAIENPFFNLVPSWGVIPLVVLSTLATVIASQALISGLFSLTMQAVQLDYAPRVRIDHTSSHAFGQVYIPAINWGLLVACLGLVIGFKSSSALAAAYGVAVTATMVITTLLFAVIARTRMRWPLPGVVALAIVFLTLEGAFFGANVFKIPAGGWFPLVVGAVIFTILTTWHTGREMVRSRVRRGEQSLRTFVKDVLNGPTPPMRIPGLAIYLFSVPEAAPPAMITNIRHHNVLNERIIVVSVLTDHVPRVRPRNRAEIIECGDGICSIVLHYGFLEDPDIPKGLREGDALDMGLDIDSATFFVSHEALRVTELAGMAQWREHLFNLIHRNSSSAAEYFCIPADRLMIVGVSVEI